MTRDWAAAMAARKMDYRYIEFPGEDHRTVIEKSMRDVFAFLQRQQAARQAERQSNAQLLVSA